MTRQQLLDEAVRRTIPKFVSGDGILYLCTERVGTMNVWTDIEPPVISAVRKEFYRLTPWANS